ncbi:DUF493 domain-containing protein [Candidatus Parabeggiatoa sp. HSG14]|uniref:HP0495 family protein n=1 Tax=Candidatus Parabeggiatoa sp. HSG14 TaxID=3055593 RepID=UPI0025A744A0|nr:DUF493 domain-containing protein [Thiotrichales bacterium HSG14]
MTKQIFLNSSLQKKDNEELFEFPCEFPIKVMGRAGENFDHLVLEIVRRHCDGIEEIEEKAVKKRTSSGGKYMSVTVTFTAQSRTQLDALYEELSNHERVVMVF